MGRKYTFSYDKSVIKFLKKHPKITERFFEKLEIMSIDPFSKDLDVKPLKWKDAGSYRLRVGEFRFKFLVIEEQIVIYFWWAGSRWDVYKN